MHRRAVVNSRFSFCEKFSGIKTPQGVTLCGGVQGGRPFSHQNGSPSASRKSVRVISL